ncbi:MAG: hypothetical protein KJP22_12795 [Acidimicrobiia bacterium]|nr:hypothetical protein [Acidimicrobiia bacterium]MBT8194275.1 hypothetical protein [Acidimicrobiia bacterium]NNJ47127.1 hypothetical protein [Acidimicrobiia bacterium]NNL12207.1 hypothetical protein [Acidimicrobiia bacterium]
MSSLLDQYERRARLAPVLLAGLPVAVLLVSLGATSRWPWAAAGLIAQAGAVIPLTELARHRGKHVESVLWIKWGQSPLARLLADTRSPTAALARRYISDLYPNVVLASGARVVDPLDMQRQYEVVGDILRHKVRRLSGNEVVTAENRSYGFHRNLLGVRRVGLVASGVAVLSAAALLVALEDSSGSWPALASGVAMLGFWLWYPSEQRVRQAGERYAEAVIGLIASQAADSTSR